MTREAYVVGVDTHLVRHGSSSVRMLYVVLEETPENAIEAVRAKVSATCAVDAQPAGTLTHDSIRKLRLQPGRVRQL
jgi:hypothetical protein